MTASLPASSTPGSRCLCAAGAWTGARRPHAACLQDPAPPPNASSVGAPSALGSRADRRRRWTALQAGPDVAATGRRVQRGAQRQRQPRVRAGHRCAGQPRGFLRQAGRGRLHGGRRHGRPQRPRHSRGRWAPGGGGGGVCWRAAALAGCLAGSSSCCWHHWNADRPPPARSRYRAGQHPRRRLPRHSAPRAGARQAGGTAPAALSALLGPWPA